MALKMSRCMTDAQVAIARFSAFADVATRGTEPLSPVLEQPGTRDLADQDGTLAGLFQTIEALYLSSRAARWSVSVEAFARAVWDGVDSAAAADPDQIPKLLMNVHAEELALALGCARGDDQAWAEFSWEYHAAIYEAAFSLTPNVVQARELADSVRGRLSPKSTDGSGKKSRFTDFHGRSSLKTWLRVVVLEKFFDEEHYKSCLEAHSETFSNFCVNSRSASEQDEQGGPQSSNQAVRNFVDEERCRSCLDILSEAPSTFGASGRCVSQQDEQRHPQSLGEALRAVLQDLPARERMLLNYHYVHQLSPEQVSRLIGGNLPSVSAYTKGLKKKLRKRGAKRGLGKDQSLENLVVEKLWAQLENSGKGCPAVEILAACFEQSLTAGEQAECETHLATCLLCQEILAELARLEMADDRPAQFPEGSSAQDPNAWALRLALAIPFLAVVIWAGLSHPGEFRYQLRQVAKFVLEQPPRAQAEDLSTRPIGPPLASGAMAKREAAGRQNQNDQMVTQASPMHSSGLDRLSTKPQNRVRHAAHRRAVAHRRTASRARVGSGLRAVKTKSDDDRSLPGFTVLGAASRALRRWRVGRQGLVQKFDARGTSLAVTSGVQADLYDIGFASPSVGWTAGQKGTLLRTADGGATWRRISTPSEEDLVHVDAVSALGVRVITRSGQYLATTDGGSSWTLSRQQ